MEGEVSLEKRITELEKNVKEVEVANAHLIKVEEEILTRLDIIARKYKELKDRIEGTTVARIRI